MTYPHHKNRWQDELWNVSLLPTVKASPNGTTTPRDPRPPGGSALPTAALLSISELPLAKDLPAAA